MNKFGWLQALRKDARVTDGEYRVASALCTDFTRRDGVGWAVELDVLADSVPGGVSRDRLIKGLKKMVDLGYIVETSRSGGGRGVKARRSHNLVSKPKTPASGVSPQTPDATAVGIGKTPDASVGNPRRYGRKPPTLASEEVLSELLRHTPSGTSSGTPSGTRCRRHTHIVDDAEVPPCRECAAARRDAEERVVAEHAAIRRAIDGCPVCDNVGRLDDLTDCPHHPNFRQLARTSA